MAVLDYTHKNGVATLILNNPPQNRMSFELQVAFTQAIMDIKNRNDTRVICIKAYGDDFSFGGDIVPWKGTDAKTAKRFIEEGLKVMNLLEELPVPVVVAVHGHCIGGGLELALRGDFIIAAENTKFGHPEATIGIFTLLGGVQRVADRIGRTKALRWAMTSELIEAQHAYDIGLISEVVALDKLNESVDAWVKRIASGPTLAHVAHKKLLNAWSNGGVKDADNLLPDLMAKTIVSKDAQGAIEMAIKALEEGQTRPAYPFNGC